MATVHLPRSLVALFPDPPPRHVEIEATSIADLIERLDERWPGMSDRLCDAGPTIREHINIFLDGQRTTLTGVLTPGSVVHIIPAVAGG